MGDAVKKPLLTIKRDDRGCMMVFDENGMCLAYFKVMTPNCHQPGFIGTENRDAGLNMDLAHAMVEAVQKAWDSPSYKRFFKEEKP
jgi:hypothetical protein